MAELSQADAWAAGEAWMRGVLSSEEYFAMARRSVGVSAAVRRLSVWGRLVRRWGWS